MNKTHNFEILSNMAKATLVIKSKNILWNSINPNCIQDDEIQNIFRQNYVNETTIELNLPLQLYWESMLFE